MGNSAMLRKVKERVETLLRERKYAQVLPDFSL